MRVLLCGCRYSLLAASLRRDEEKRRSPQGICDYVDSSFGAVGQLELEELTHGDRDGQPGEQDGVAAGPDLNFRQPDGRHGYAREADPRDKDSGRSRPAAPLVHIEVSSMPRPASTGLSSSPDSGPLPARNWPPSSVHPSPGQPRRPVSTAWRATPPTRS